MEGFFSRSERRRGRREEAVLRGAWGPGLVSFVVDLLAGSVLAAWPCWLWVSVLLACFVVYRCLQGTTCSAQRPAKALGIFFACPTIRVDRIPYVSLCWFPLIGVFCLF